MNKYGEVLEDGSMQFVRMLPGPIERVWDYLTDPEKRAQWLCGGETATQAGGKIVMAFDNSTLTPHEDDHPPEKYKDAGGPVTFEGKVLGYERPHLLQFTWPNADGGEGVVTFRLSEEGEKVRLELTHKGIRRASDFIGASGGWHVHLDILDDKLAGRDPGPFWTAHTAAENEYEKRFANHLATLT
ncbi:MAG: SRPBCC family protein [Pseudomonadota bacterium]